MRRASYSSKWRHYFNCFVISLFSRLVVKLTVITCTYNAGATLERTMRSVQEQDYPYIEHIVVDGASRDATLTIARRYHCTLFSGRDRGLYDAMNRGIALATGDYIVFLNAGDTFADAQTVSEIFANVNKETGETPAVIYGRTMLVDDEGLVLGERRLKPPARLTWRSFRDGMLVCHQAFYVATELARSNPYDLSYRYSADFDWCIRVLREGAEQGRAMLFVDRPLCHYLSEGMTTANRWASLKERFRVMCRHYGWACTVARHAWFVLRLCKSKL